MTLDWTKSAIVNICEKWVVDGHEEEEEKNLCCMPSYQLQLFLFDDGETWEEHENFKKKGPATNRNQNQNLQAVRRQFKPLSHHI